MRYLKAIAQDRSGNCRADTVILHFYENREGRPDELSHEALAVDMNADGVIDMQCAGDINRDGQCNIRDKQLLKEFANIFLKLNWFNQGESAQRSLSVYVDHYGKTSSPNAVKLEFHDVLGAIRKQSLAYSAAAYDADGNGVPESFTNSDVDRNGVADKADKEWVRALATSFLAMLWYEQLPPDANQSCVAKLSTSS
jgi:hypothetical protein